MFVLGAKLAVRPKIIQHAGLSGGAQVWLDAAELVAETCPLWLKAVRGVPGRGGKE